MSRAAIIAHLERLLGPVAFRADRPGEGELALHAIAPSDDDPAWTVFTTGASARPMTLPAGTNVPARAELMVRLPAAWPLTAAVLATGGAPEVVWPLRWIETLARLPHQHATWLGPFHTIPNGEPPRPLCPDTALAAMMLVPPAALDDGDDVVVSGGERIALYGLLPLHPGELAYKLSHGVPALLERLVAADVDDVFDVARPSAC